MSEMAMATVLVRMARPVGPPDAFGPTRRRHPVVGVDDRDEDGEDDHLQHRVEDVAPVEEEVEVVQVGSRALMGDGQNGELGGQVGARTGPTGTAG